MNVLTRSQQTIAGAAAITLTVGVSALFFVHEVRPFQNRTVTNNASPVTPVPLTPEIKMNPALPRPVYISPVTLWKTDGPGKFANIPQFSPPPAEAVIIVAAGHPITMPTRPAVPPATTEPATPASPTPVTATPTPTLILTLPPLPPLPPVLPTKPVTVPSVTLPPVVPLPGVTVLPAVTVPAITVPPVLPSATPTLTAAPTAPAATPTPTVTPTGTAAPEPTQGALSGVTDLLSGFLNPLLGG